MISSDLVREDEAALHLGVSKRTLQKWRLTGEGPTFIKLGGAVRYRERDLAAFIEASARRSTSDPGAKAA